MNKFLALVATIVLLLAVTVPLSATAPPFRIPASYDFSLEMQLGLDVLCTGQNCFAELPLIASFLQDVAVDAHGTVVMDVDNLLTVGMFAEMNVRAGIFNIPVSFWLEWDYTNIEDPVYRIVIRVPDILLGILAMEEPALAKPYWVMDYAPLFAAEPEMSETMVESLDMIKTVFDIMPEPEHLGGNLYRMTITDEWIAQNVVHMMEAIFQMFDDELAEEDWEEISNVLGIFEHVTLLSEDFVTTYTLNDDGFPIQEESGFRIQIDLQEWENALAIVDPFREPGVFTPEAGPLFPELVITLDAAFTAEYTNINTAGPVIFPVLTLENSVDLNEMLPGSDFGIQ